VHGLVDAAGGVGAFAGYLNGDNIFAGTKYATCINLKRRVSSGEVLSHHMLDHFFAVDKNFASAVHAVRR
jgi:hypothetical protein